jgi:hypothetical protein
MGGPVLLQRMASEGPLVVLPEFETRYNTVYVKLQTEALAKSGVE